MTLAELHNHAKRTGKELALTIAAIETECAADPDQHAMLQHALTRLMECSMWIEQAVAADNTEEKGRPPKGLITS